jgi:hypothetical protein
MSKLLSYYLHLSKPIVRLIRSAVGLTGDNYLFGRNFYDDHSIYTVSLAAERCGVVAEPIELDFS